MTEVNAVFGSNDRIEYKDLAKLEYLTMVTYSIICNNRLYCPINYRE